MRLSPINQQCWLRFHHNRRGYWSLWIFLIIFALSLGADLLANDKPLLVSYSESDFGGALPTATDYQDPWLQNRLNQHG
ncbi:microcin ABC transporter permease|nr:microcin ABC transporter permease [Candidatus Pantoea persica]